MPTSKLFWFFAGAAFCRAWEAYTARDCLKPSWSKVFNTGELGRSVHQIVGCGCEQKPAAAAAPTVALNPGDSPEDGCYGDPNCSQFPIT